MNDKVLEIKDNIDMLGLTLARMVGDDPAILLALERERSLSGNNGSWIDLYNALQDVSELATYKKNVKYQVEQVDVSTIERVYIQWAKYGWVFCEGIAPLDTWNVCPATQKEADKVILSHINTNKIKTILDEIESQTNKKKIFGEVRKCFEYRLYTACASLLLSLIDGLLIRYKANQQSENRKTGATAFKRMRKELENDSLFGSTSIFRLELLNFDAYINSVYENAKGFLNEPENINRNYVLHGMNIRSVRKKDCIKLLIAYKKAVEFCL